MMDISSAALEKVSAHRVGNKTNEEDLLLSKSPLDTDDPRLQELLIQFFLGPFAEPELYQFSFTGNQFKLNPLYNYATQVFEAPKTFHKTSSTIASHLYEVAVHPQIKSGDLLVAYFSGLSLDGEETDAIGIYKIENRYSFLKLDTENFQMGYDDGINIDKMDKGCLIFNLAKEEGYRVCVLDKSSKSVDAQYWTNSFLNILPCKDDFHNTRQILSITKSFVTDKYTEEFEVTKTDQIDLLNRSIDYFKTHESFDKKEFEKDVLYHPEIIKSFRKFDNEYREQHDLDIEDGFDISSQAVKKQARFFKSVLKLDKNFHVYIHGNKDMIERGVEKDGRKYYKIYYENEA